MSESGDKNNMNPRERGLRDNLRDRAGRLLRIGAIAASISLAPDTADHPAPHFPSSSSRPSQETTLNRPQNPLAAKPAEAATSHRLFVPAAFNRTDWVGLTSQETQIPRVTPTPSPSETVPPQSIYEQLKAKTTLLDSVSYTLNGKQYSTELRSTSTAKYKIRLNDVTRQDVGRLDAQDGEMYGVTYDEIVILGDKSEAVGAFKFYNDVQINIGSNGNDQFLPVGDMAAGKLDNNKLVLYIVPRSDLPTNDAYKMNKIDQGIAGLFFRMTRSGGDMTSNALVGATEYLAVIGKTPFYLETK